MPVPTLTVLVRAVEVSFSLDGAVVLALWFVEDDPDPLAGRELGHADIGDLEKRRF